MPRFGNSLTTSGVFSIFVRCGPRPSHWIYRGQRFVARNLLGVVTATFLSMGVVGFSIMTMIQATQLARERDRARQERDQAEIVTSLLVDAFESTSPDQAHGQTISVRQILDKGAERIAYDLEDQPELRASLQHTIGSIYTRLGVFEEAEPLLSDALDRRRSQLGNSHPLVADTWHEWATLHYTQGDLKTAEAALLEEMKIRTSEGDLAPLAQALHLKGLIAGTAGRREEREALHQEALHIQRATLGRNHPETIQGIRWLAASKRLLGKHEEAVALGQEALAAQQKLYPGDHPLTATLKYDLSRVHMFTERFDQAAELAQEAEEIQRRLYGDIHTSRSDTLNTLGAIERERGNPIQAESHFRECLRIQIELVGESSPLLARAAYNLATLLHRDLEQPSKAETYYRLAVDNYRKGPGTANNNMGYYLMGLGRVVSDLGRPEEAETLLLEALLVFGKRSSGDRMTRNEATASSALSGALLQLNRYEESEKLLLEAYPVLVDRRGAPPPNHSKSRSTSSRTLQSHRPSLRSRDLRKALGTLGSP